MNTPLSEQLNQLYDLVIRERECARDLRLDELQDVVSAKEALMQELQFTEDMNVTAADKELADKIRFENRRNAYLLWSALNWIRESMAFFGRKSAPDAYNTSGSVVSSANGGRLLSGRI
jgi:flagellar biosynthesis/type III secretory pathway chaperone